MKTTVFHQNPQFSSETQLIKLDQMVLKGVNWVHNDKIMLNVLERSQLGTQ